MPTVFADKDNLDERNAEFTHERIAEPVFLNSVPKCGTHLIRNIMRMFVPLEQHYASNFIQLPVLRQSAVAFDPSNPRLSWGHLLFTDESVMPLHHVRHVVMARDPYDWVLARARFFLSDTFEGNLEHLKGGRVTVDEVLNMMIFGIHQKAPSLDEIFRHNAVAWLGTSAYFIRFEDLLDAVKNPDEDRAHVFFKNLFDHCGIVLPSDWKERVRIGADRAQSGTARENLKGLDADVPDELPALQRAMVDYAAPGLRRVLGYSD